MRDDRLCLFLKFLNSENEFMANTVININQYILFYVFPSFILFEVCVRDNRLNQHEIYKLALV